MANWKAPTPGRLLASRAAAAKFGDKKLVVITGTSSGLGRKTARALLRTGQCVRPHAILELRQSGAR